MYIYIIYTSFLIVRFWDYHEQDILECSFRNLNIQKIETHKILIKIFELYCIYNVNAFPNLNSWLVYSQQTTYI